MIILFPIPDDPQQRLPKAGKGLCGWLLAAANFE